MYIPASWLYFDVEYLSERWDMHLQGDTEIKKVTPIYAASLSHVISMYCGTLKMIKLPFVAVILLI